jgi:hypothetical protein
MKKILVWSGLGSRQMIPTFHDLTHGQIEKGETCPLSIYVSMPSVHVHSQSPCPCSLSMSISVAHAWCPHLVHVHVHVQVCVVHVCVVHVCGVHVCIHACVHVRVVSSRNQMTKYKFLTRIQFEIYLTRSI